MNTDNRPSKKKVTRKKLPVVRRVCDHPSCKGHPTWRVLVSCSKCHWRGIFVLRKGHDFWTGYECPNCGNSWGLTSHGDPAYAD